MAIKNPLVMGSNGVPQALQAGDTLLTTTSQVDIRSLINGEASAAIVIGAPVYVSAAGTVRRAQANAFATAKVVGLGYDASTAAAASGNVAANGVMVATTAQWDVVSGQTGGLTAGAYYFLDAATAGRITTTPPVTVGQVVIALGVALSTTEFNLAIGVPYLL